LAPGRHTLSILALRKLCVEPFVGSVTREPLFDELLRLREALIRSKLPCDIWVDGSYLSEKMDPDDIDLSVKVDADLIDALRAGNSTLDIDKKTLLRDISLRQFSLKLDSYIVVSFPIGHTKRSTDEDRWEYWATYWGVARGRWCKGIAVIRVGENDVGLRITP
jgi:hypothetical protein